MWLATLCHIEMAGELTVLRATVSSTVDSALGHSPDEIFRMEVVGDLVLGSRGWRSSALGLSNLP
jgi:hypothetical protein